ncbi:20S-pre-rRNA D-site endonuclease nob1 [Ceratocystis platani]|uniref:20S-pre-rRNA D-site endonuclease NOB1 n=1 Tax=Ceratocystis fimbriata f. sp. platani TaxID=88771 RepID=A0A0F8DDR1_CERFI|nr:20S-pre-rRNA D-site endonuclease nob1 [Ceratocystis platani]
MATHIATPTSAATPTPAATTPKTIHSLIIDTGPLIKNDPPISSLMARATQLFIIPSVLDEVRDAHTRTRLQNLLPFLTLRNPKPASVEFIKGFARKTGDLEVLSRPDLHLLALAYEIDCERHGNSDRLRQDPSQTSTNAQNNAPGAETKAETPVVEEGEGDKEEIGEARASSEPEIPVADDKAEVSEEKEQDQATEEAVSTALENLSLEHSNTTKVLAETAADSATKEEEEEGEASDNEGGWITPSNLKKRIDEEKGSLPSDDVTFMEAALLTTDFAMQNVALRIGLHIMSSSMHRITTVKTFILRCHGCFATTKDMAKQFCPRCGQPTLIRTSCTTDANGNFKLFLKRNFQWNNRGNVYSIPKPIHGSSNGKMPKNVSVGGQKGWGRNLILAEDQKEFVKASNDRRRLRQRDLMDDDYLPGILTGERKGSSDRIRVGAGRNINSKKRR